MHIEGIVLRGVTHSRTDKEYNFQVGNRIRPVCILTSQHTPPRSFIFMLVLTTHANTSTKGKCEFGSLFYPLVLMRTEMFMSVSCAS